MARDRQRAKQRKARRQANTPARSQPWRGDVPGELEHASGEVDEFEAALVAGAAGEPAVSDEAADGETSIEDEPSTLEELSDESFDELEEEVDEFEARAEGRAPADAAEDAELERQAMSTARAKRPETTPGAPTKHGPARFAAFLRACWAELQRVQWPDRRQVAQATGVVIGFVIVAGLYLGLADYVAKRVVDFII